MRPPPLNLLGLAPLARPPGWCQLPPTLGCPPGPGGVSTDLQAVLVETSKATQQTGDDLILLRLQQRLRQLRPRTAALQQQHARRAEHLTVVQPYRPLASPHPQRV